MRVLFFDTETTGLPVWKEPSDHPDQPHIVDIAIDLWDGDQLTRQFDAIVNPGIEIPEDVSSIHGITTEMARDTGITKEALLEAFMDMAQGADLIVGHNVSFDIRMIRIEAAKARGEKWDNPLPTFCTMRKSTNHCKILSAKPRHEQDWKWPRLTEAFAHFFNEEIPDAHRARPDCDASRRIFFHLKTLEA